MDSDDSRDGSSASESGGKRTHSPDSQSQSAPQSPDSGAKSHRSRSRSSDSKADSRSRSSSSENNVSHLPTPKSPGSGPQSPENSKTQSNGPHSPSTPNSSPSNSPRQPKSPDSDLDENRSIKSQASSRSSKKSKNTSPYRSSRASSSSRASRSKNGQKSNGDTSDSSLSSVDSSSRKNKNINKTVDTAPEEISDGDMESDHDDIPEMETVKQSQKNDINITHEDLSDVSDLEDSMGERTDNDETDNKIAAEEKTELDDSNIQNTNFTNDVNKVPEKINRTEEGEEQLDFEAEDGECGEVEPTKDLDGKIDEPHKDNKDDDKDGAATDEQKKEIEKEELEEGEVTDEDEVRPEETEPRPVCRFFSRGQCTWGASCRFLHPGVTDKGNYTMFELIRPVVPGEYGREDRVYGKPDPPQVESAWERGLRTAKEMLRKSIKRKEQDIDFEEKKMNLSLAQEEFDKENGYYGRVASPESRYVRHLPPVDYPIARPTPEEYYSRRQVVYEPDYIQPPPRERVRSYRELPPHRMPDYYSNKYEEEQQQQQHHHHQPQLQPPPPQQQASKLRRAKREVIVQRVEEKQGSRGDEWSDPWMRSKSPSRRKESSRKRSYSSGSSYSSSSSSRSSSESSHSSYRSRSRSSHRGRRRSRQRKSRHVSPSVIVSERKAANERAALMNPPAPRKRAPSPSMMRVSAAANPPAPSLKEDQFGRTKSKLATLAALARVKGRRKSSRSSSDSSGSSSSDSDSSGSSSSTSRDESSPARRASGMDIQIAKAMDALKSGGASEKRQIKLNLKNPTGVRKSDQIGDAIRKTDVAMASKKRLANSPPAGGDSKSKKTTSRREELLKQLKAVEDAIAKKRSKVN